MSQSLIGWPSAARRSHLALWLLIAAFLVAPAAAQTSVDDKQPLDHDAYEIWNRIESRGFSNDGAWVYAEMGPENHDNELRIHHVDSDRQYTVPRGSSARFSADSRYLVTEIEPPVMDVRRARHNGDDAPEDSLGIVTLETGEITKIADVSSFRLPDDGGSHVAYLRVQDEDGDESDENEENGNGDEGDPLVLRNLETGAEQTFRNVTSYQFSPEGDWLVYTANAGDQSGVFAVQTDTGQSQPVLTGEGEYTRLTIDEDGRQVAFLTTRDTDDEVSYTLYRADLGSQAEAIAVAGDPGIPEGWVVSNHGNVSFSDDGTRLFYGTAPADRLPRDEDDEDEEFEYDVEEDVGVDVWHWEDERLQTVQLVQADRERRRTYEAVAHLDGNPRLVQLATEDVPNVSLGSDGDADVAVASTNRPYAQRNQWASPSYYDIYLVDVNTGDMRQVLEEVQSWASLSPDANYITWWDRDQLDWMAQSVEPGSRPINLTTGLPPVHDELHDRPYGASAYGSVGWTENDDRFLIQDRYDIWALDPAGQQQPENVTQGVGRANDLRFDYVQLDRDEDFIDLTQPVLLSAFNDDTKSDGFYRLPQMGAEPQEIVMMERRFSTPRKAEDADRLMFTRQSFQEFPDIWVSGMDLTDMRQITDANPQQDEYRWGTAEQVDWLSDNGEPLQGILYKPEGFDANEEYPMMVYFYERRSDNLHSHSAPEPHRSTINIPFYVSRGYVVFVPDIVYEEGYPGESAMQSIMPGVQYVVDQGFVDPDRVGLQGHSWGGYQIAYMVTKTDFFAAAEAGAPVANMTSAYGGIRWDSGRNRMFQYEDTQSRIGGSLWEYPTRYWENSPLFYADNINTPLLIMHNDEDGHVPWEQGIELFVAMRRLGKPAWLINYNEQPHWPITYANKRDWAIRMQQFFDHYLMDAPAPRWMVEGVPAIEKGETLGLELTEEEPSTARPWSDPRQ